MKYKKAILYTLLILLLVFSFLLRLWPLQYSHWWDETVYLQHSEIIFSERSGYNEFDLRPPLLPIIFAGGYFIKHHVFTASIIVSLLGALGVLFAFLVGKEIYGEPTGFLCALFLGLSPYIITASHWIMTDVPSLTFFIIAFYFSTLFVKKKKTTFAILAGLFFGLSILMRFNYMVLIFVIPLYFIANNIKIRDIVLFFLGTGVVMLPYFIWAQIKYKFFLMPFLIANSAVSESTGGPSFYFSNFLNVFPIIILVGLGIYLISKIFLLNNTFKSFFEKKQKFKSWISSNSVEIVMISWILIFMLYISLTPHKEIRYMIPIALPLVVLSAQGYSLLLKNRIIEVKAFAIILILLLCFFSFSGSFSRLSEPFINSQKTNEILVSEYLKAENQGTNLIYANENYPVYAYYTGMEVRKLLEQDSKFYSTFPTNMPSKGFFLFYKDIKKEPNYEWLESNDKFTRLSKIGNVIVYLYTP